MEGLFQYNLINGTLKKIDLNFFQSEFISPKFVQIYFQEKPVLVFGINAHKKLLESGLKRYKIRNINFIKNGYGNKIPERSRNGDYYMTGAGKIEFVDEYLARFHLGSTDYKIGTNLRHLEDFFGKENVEFEDLSEYPSYLVNLGELE